MRWWIYGLVITLTACASQPRGDQQVAFDKYWRCAFDAARQHIDNAQLSTHEAAMRAQARCYGLYTRYQTANEAYLRSVVRPSGYEMATQLADQAALQKKKYVTRQLTNWVAQARE